jgi:glucosamine--fructose-6-phosphate aminotransferase (isomerizing)
VCGIVGYWGSDKPKNIILDGLRRLEYRGYDSTGVAIFDKGILKVSRAPGKLSALESKIKDLDFSGPSGIGHTRWATHGIPNEANAHPHKVGHIAIVHNGIIENYREIRKELLASGVELKSETDSELIAHLLVGEMGKNLTLLQATINVIPKLTGAYSILVINEKDPDSLIAFKNGPPMLVGIGEGEVIIASDVQAFIDRTHKVIYLDDGEVVKSERDRVEIYNVRGQKVIKKIVEVTWDQGKAEKAGFDHFMQKEIFEQPQALIQTMRDHINHESLEVKLKDTGFSDEEFLKFSRIQMIACGSAWHACVAGKYMFERLSKIATDVDIASEFRYRAPIIDGSTLVVIVSQSGETADTLACLRHCKKMGLKVLSVCNVPHSSIDREADGRLFTKAGTEIGVCSTKAFTAQLLALQLLALNFARIKDALTLTETQHFVRAMLSLPSQTEACLNHDKWFKEAAHSLAKYKGFLYLGRGISYPIALEGALKLKEITYLHAEGYPSGELKHGPIALVDATMAVIAIAPDDDLYEKNVSNIEEVRARGGQIISIGTAENEALKSLSVHYLGIPKSTWASNAILATIPIQLMSYHLACELNRDVDQPRNLAKSVTVE